MTESLRDTGLVRALGTWGLSASIFNMVVGAGIFAIPAALAASIGPYAPLAFIVCAIAIGAVAICFAEGGSRMPTSGGAYGYIEAAFGPLIGYVTATLFWFSALLGCAAVATALADVVVSVLPPPFKTTAHAGIIVAVIGGIALVNVGGVSRGASLVNGSTLLKLIPLAVFVIAGAFAIDTANLVPMAKPAADGLGRAVILALFAFVGMETALCASGEVIRPEKTIPRALAITMLSVTLLYVAIQMITQGILGVSLATSPAPLADAMARINPALRAVILIGAALSMFVYIGSDLLGSPRMLFALARDGLMPRVLGRVHPSSKAPHVAIVCYAALAIALALTGTFAQLAVLATLTIAGFYIAGCAAAWRLARRGLALTGTPLNFRWLGTAAVIGITSMIVLIALASRNEIIGLFVIIGASAAVYVLMQRIGLAGARTSSPAS